MIQLLAVALAGTAPYTVETACVEQDLMQIQARPPRKDVARKLDLERRIADVRQVEQTLEAGLAPAPRGWISQRAIPAALALAGVLGVLVAAARRSRLLAALSAVAILAAAALVIVPLQRRQNDQLRLAEARSCRLRLNEVRGAVLQAEFARCLFDLGEGAEDLQRFENEMRAGNKLDPDRLKRTRLEMSELF